MTEKGKERATFNDKVYRRIAPALGELFGVEEVPRVKEGLKFEVDGEDVIIRVIKKKEKVEEDPKELITVTGGDELGEDGEDEEG